MIKAIVFDCFGVLTTDGWLPFKQKHFGNDAEVFQNATDLNQQMSAGLISPDDFTKEIAEMADMQPHIARDQIDRSVANEQLFEYIGTMLKPSYKIGMLSNAGGNALSRLFSAEQLEMFDSIALSYEMGVVKPDARAYETIIDRLEVEPEEVVFVDDQERHCSGARDVGMQAIVYQDFDSFKTQLEARLSDTKH